MASIQHLYGETFLGQLLEIRTPKGNNYYFQNFVPGSSYLYPGNGTTYYWLPFRIEGLQEQLELNSETLEIQVVNTEVVRAFFNLEGDIRKSMVVYRAVFPDAPGSDDDLERTQISNYTLSKGMVQISCASPILALNNKIPTRVFDPSSFPSLPYFNKAPISDASLSRSR